MAFLLTLSGCSSPSFSMRGAQAHEISVDNSRFRVFWHPGGGAVEAHRISIEPLPSLVLTLEKGYRAIKKATGCRVVPGSLRGDQAIVLADVSCRVPEN